MKNLKITINIFVISLILFSTVLTPMSLSAYQEMPEEDLCDQIVEGCKEDNPFSWWLFPDEHNSYDLGCENAGAECTEIMEA
ncbi:MAG: hypothetical protein GVY20_01520 [Bacteroidetes bacterium]|jgi:hypothetical protein|nr:hypothetical protein [Bacteroidota bacterium]